MPTDQQFAELVARVTKLEANQPVHLSPAELDRFASFTVKKTPSNWKGRAIKGMRFDALTSDEALNLAGFFDYMADKSSADPEPKKKDDGTFWWQQDRKTAAALRGLAERSKASIPDF